jgi:capsular exopolysaccharide synthesis family protein
VLDDANNTPEADAMKTPTNGRPSGGAASDRTIREYMAILMRQRWTILTVFLIVLIATIVFTKLSSPVFTATTNVLLNKSELGTTLFADGTRADRSETITQNELTILNSNSLADSVAKRLLATKFVDEERTIILPILRANVAGAPEDSLAPIYEISGRIARSVDFSPIRESDVIRITASSKDAREAALLANTFAMSYRDRNIWMSRTKTRSFREFLESQAREKRRQLEDTENSLQGYMQREGIVSLDDESKKVIDQLAQLEASRDATEIRLRELENTLASYEESLPQQETNAARAIGEATDPYIRQLQDEIAKLEVSRDVTAAQNPSSVGREIVNERIREIDARINVLRQQLQRRTDEFLQSLTPTGGQTGDAAGYLRTVKKNIIESKIEVQSLQAKKKALEAQIAQYETKFGRIPKKNVELARLQRARLSNEKLFLMVEERFNEANINEKANIGYIEIVEPAAIPAVPSSPKMLVNLALGLVMGLGLGLVVAFVREFVDVRIYAPEDLKRRGLKTLATVRDIDEEVIRLGGDRTSEEHRPEFEARLITVTFPFSSVSESFRQLRTTIQFGRQGEAPHTLMVTSPSPGEGKSTVVSNIAVAFAQTGKKVLLVDADLRRPTVDSKFGLKREPGISEVLAGKMALHAVTQKTSIENLSVIASGGIPKNPAEALGSKKMKEVLEQAKKEYEFVLLDTSPVLAVTDSSVLSTFTDATIMVVSAGRTRVEELLQGVEILESVGGKVVGVVINNFDVRQAYGVSARRTRGGGYVYAQSYTAEVDSGADSAKKTERT